MLRTLLGVSPREDNRPFQESSEAMEAFIRLCCSLTEQHPERALKFRTYTVWTEGLRRSLDELEESLFAAGHFAGRIRHDRWETLTEPEKLDYDRHVYFDKNAYIRIFSQLDKLGTLLNDFLELRTEQVKHRFSYFTVLRRLRETGRHPELAEALYALKDRHDDAMRRLRNRRNMEMHYMNAELKDDLNAGFSLNSGYEDTWRLENLSANLHDAAQGREMVLSTLREAFGFACKRLRGMAKG